MSEVNKINVSVLKDYRSNFVKEKNNFINKSYSTFSSSYISSCSDPYVARMHNSLDKLYRQIEKGYSNIDKWWKSYNSNIASLENFLSNSGKSGSISESNVRSYANSKLSALSSYKSNVSGTVSSKVIGLVDSISFVNNGVVSTIDGFSKEDYAYDVASVNFNDIVNNNDIINNMKEVVSAVGENLTDGINKFYDNVLEFSYEVNSKVSDTASSAWSTITGWWDDICDWWTDDAWPWIKEAASAVWDVLKSVGATIANFIISLVEGLLSFVEAMVDFVVLVGTGVVSIFTGLYDGGQAIYGAITGNEWESVTKKMWGGVQGFVATQYVTGWFDSFYAETTAGSWIKNNSYLFDEVRSIGSGIGYITGVVVLTIATFGAGSVVATGGSVTASTAVAATTTAQMAITATAAGIGKGTQNAWANGADLLEGLSSGTLSGIWEGIQFYIGGKIGSSKFFNLNSEIGQKIVNGTARVILDGADSGLEGFVQPFIDTIYKDGYYDEQGNYIEFTKDQDFADRYSILFNSNGGWSNVWTQATVGSGASMFGEAFDLNRYFKNGDSSVKVNIENNPTVSAKRLDLDYEEELTFFKSNEIKKNEFINNVINDEVEVNVKTSALTPNQIKTVNDINKYINESGGCLITIRTTSELPVEMLNQVSDLSKLQVVVDGNFRDINGEYKPKYNKQRYLDRVTYTGYEALYITSKLDELQSRIDMSLPVSARARQIYDCLATEYSYMRDFANYEDGHKISASLRGLTSYNNAGKTGLVCAGYAQAFKELCDRCDITADYIRGRAFLSDGRTEAHAWNIIIDENNNIIPVDVTWDQTGNGKWFGPSKEFQDMHVADPDEIFKTYYVKSNNDIISETIEFINNKYGYSEAGLNRLKRYVETGDASIITRDGNARDIISKMNIEDIKTYINNVSIKEVENIIDIKYGQSGIGKRYLQKYVETGGDLRYITRTGDARDTISKIPFEDIVNYINN